MSHGILLECYGRVIMITKPDSKKEPSKTETDTSETAPDAASEQHAMPVRIHLGFEQIRDGWVQFRNQRKTAG